MHIPLSTATVKWLSLEDNLKKCSKNPNMSKSKKIRHLFDKKIDFANNATFELPTEAFVLPKWSIPSFQNDKAELNRTKSLLNQFNLEEWSRHTKHRDPSSYITRFVKQKFHPELVTQAWCKFYECLCSFNVIPKEAITSSRFTSFHLCEAPGAFISALNHYIASQGLDWTWGANTLNPDHEGNSPQEMIPDDRLLRHTYKNWYFGSDFTGNVTKYCNHVDLVEKIHEKVWLVTADGSIDCSSDPGNQESHVEFLHYCETLTALALLKPGGSFVLKIFTMFEHSTICLLYLLNVCFGKVSLFKPGSSKSGNSEVYVICQHFKGPQVVEKIWPSLLSPYKSGHFVDKSMFDLNKINPDFLTQLLHISRFFMQKQIEHILDNIRFFRNASQNESGKVHQIKVYVANRYINKYKLKSISRHLKLVPTLDISQFFSNEVKKINFVNGVAKFDAKNLVQVNPTLDILDVKLGEKFTQVKSSRFCDNLPKLNFSNKMKSHGPLYQLVANKLGATATIISLDSPFESYYDFQKDFFYKIFHSKKRNFLIVGVPLLTNFLAGVMYILISCFSHVHVHQNGCIILCGGDLAKIAPVFATVEKRYRSVPDCGILQIVPPGLLYSNNFFDFVWNYNRLLQFLNKC
ncbi:cap-specific mRNA (nucleoside-2'-O-)-methyltransferase 2 isoform X2 [Tribolium castaneum]|uniref:cap-specific mRNA (nucleoside-2'-O-)-methyltransferase 2 isoform X2 n=1 Tax=Tribolium castaneum TaxID=7070 RepID=UPI00077DB17E|nr:PREDICTED: cap-specific mRNA (nucleoside-2'-O-)-methyltransferase 2 isoform X2 [Tribolium castaneum]|eukprot:XP_015839665.1 PREDICTED: cap-specific mRNA (nucleoside-2'-O-)-methyltransferase 2 isoform X2 [Tribolium castaneum]